MTLNKKWAAILFLFHRSPLLIKSQYLPHNALSFLRLPLARFHYFRNHLQASLPVTLFPIQLSWTFFRPMRSPRSYNFSLLLFLICGHPLCASSTLALPSDSQDLQRFRSRVSRVCMSSERRFPFSNDIIAYFQKIAIVKLFFFCI